MVASRISRALPKHPLTDRRAWGTMKMANAMRRYIVLTYHRLLIAIVILLVCAAGPSNAWLYDAGIAQHAGVSISNGAWVLAPFEVESDCYATTFGAAVARGMGPTDAGFDVYLATAWSGLPGSAIVKLPQPLVPLDTQYVYYYGSLSEPVLLRAGTIYSLVLMPTSPNLLCSVSWSAKPGYYGWGTSDYGESWHRLALPLCVRVDGYAVPEPPFIAVFLFSMLSLGIQMGKLRYPHKQVDCLPVSVPET